MNRFALLCCVLLAAPAAVQAQDATTERGIAFGVHLGDRIVNLAFAGPVNVIEGGFFAGFKYSRVIVGLSVDASRIGIGAANVITLVFVPGVQVALLRSNDQKVELFAQADIGYGRIIVEGAMGGGGGDFRYVLGPGLRYWLHPQLSLSAMAGLRGDLFHMRGFAGGSETMSSAISIIAALQLLGVFPI